MTRPFRSSRIAWSTRRLAGVAKGLARAGGERVDSLCRQILAVRVGGEDLFFGRSRLNNDGVPLQLCLSSAAKGSALRLIGDPGADLESPEARHRCSVGAVAGALESSGTASLAPWVEKTLRAVLPGSEEARARYRDGFVWMGVSPEQPGLALYVETAPLGQAGGWEVAETWLRDVLPTMEHATPLLELLRAHCTVASLGLEGSDPANTRAKVYYRLTAPMAIGALGIELLVSPEISAFLAAAMGEYGVDLDGLVLSAGFSLATGALADVKVDLCGHCLTHSDSDWVALVDRCCEEHRLAPMPVREALATGDCAVALVGFGLDVERKPRLNLYLQGRPRRDAPGREEIEAAMRDAVQALCALQEESGRVTDYHLPVGASDQWVSAYAGLALASAGEVLADRSASAAAERAADWLTSGRPYAEGWGYNGITGPDADSTSIALALLRALGRPIQPADQQFLRRSWRTGGGIATYDGPDAWGAPHWDVTPWGYLGLSAREQAALRGEFLQALEANRMPNGLWRAYWWRTPFYSTFVTLEVLRELGLPEPWIAVTHSGPPVQIDNAFDLSCLIGVELFRGAGRERVGSHLRALLDWQDGDGRWPGHANLRVTDDSCYAPWDEPVGEYFTDDAATITTATALRVLAHGLRMGAA